MATADKAATCTGESELGKVQPNRDEPQFTLAAVSLSDQRDALKSFDSKSCNTPLPKIELAQAQTGNSGTASDASSGFSKDPPLDSTRFHKTPAGKVPDLHNETWPSPSEVPSPGFLRVPPSESPDRPMGFIRPPGDKPLPPSPLSAEQTQKLTSALLQSYGAEQSLDSLPQSAETANEAQRRALLGNAKQFAADALARYPELQQTKARLETWIQSLPPADKAEAKRYDDAKASIERTLGTLPAEDQKHVHSLMNGFPRNVPQEWQEKNPNLVDEATKYQAARLALRPEVLKNLDARDSINHTQQRDVNTVLRAAYADFVYGNNRDGARESVRKLAETLSPEDRDKAFAGERGQRVTDALGMTKGSPFREIDPVPAAQDIVNKAWKAMAGEAGAVQSLRDALKSTPQEVLNKVGTLLEKNLGQGNAYTQGVSVHRDGQGDVTEMKFHPSVEQRLKGAHSVNVTISAVDNLNADHAFAHAVRQEYEKLPVQIRELLAKNNVKTIVSDKVTDGFPGDFKPGVVGTAPEGHNMVVAQRSLRGDRTQAPQEVLRHEVGHKIDELLDQLTRSPEFKAAFAADREELRSSIGYNPDDPAVKYFDNSISPEKELAAEAYAKMLGGSDYDEFLNKNYKRSQKLLADKLEEFKRNWRP